MAKKKIYAVRVGKVPGIYETWDECKANIDGFPGAEFLGFSTREEADAYMNHFDIYEDKVKSDFEKGFSVAFTDGSYFKEENQYSYGVIFFKDSLESKIKMCNHGDNPRYISSKNIAGELIGAINAIDYAVSLGVQKLKIYHDYVGVANIIKGTEHPSSAVGIMYLDVYNTKFKDIIELEFEHVGGHTNNKFNDEVDALAKSGLKSKELQRGQNYFVVQPFGFNQVEACLNDIKNEIDLVSWTKTSSETNKQVYSAKFTNSNGVVDKLTISVFNNNKTMVQGNCRTNFYNIFLSYVTDVVDNPSDVSRILQDAYKKPINLDDFNKEIDKLIEILPSDYPPNNVTLIKNALLMKKIDVAYYDYSVRVFPIARALDGHLKYLLEKIGYHVAANASFKCFEPGTTGGTSVLKPGILASLPPVDPTLKANIEKCYQWFKTQRCSLLHFGEILGPIDNTRILNREESDDLIDEAIDLIYNTLIV